jgi:hypothetical protein
VVFANFLRSPYAILTNFVAVYGEDVTSEVAAMAGQTQYFYTVELSALEENLSRSIDRVARLHEKAMKRSDFKAADQISRLQRSINVAQSRITRLK